MARRIRRVHRHPETGEPLTSRTRDDRTCGYDFNFNAPKGVSLLYGLYRDRGILEAFRTSVNETMRDIENDMMVRVRKGGRDTNRESRNLVYGEFIHFTARPVGGIADPSLHAHCFTFNVSRDPVEKQWKAGQFRQIKRDSNYWEALFHSRLAKRMADLGYGVNRRGRFWEVAGLSSQLLERFSKRTRKIKERAKELGIISPERMNELGAATREKKTTQYSGQELQDLWWGQLTDADRTRVDQVHNRETAVSAGDPRITAAAAMDHAVQHVFERDAVVPEKRLLETALRHSVGTASVDEVHKELTGHGILRRAREGDKLASTREVLGEEHSMLAFARHGRASFQPLVPGHVIGRDWLNAGQKAAVNHVLETTDRVTIIRGLAGTGKTTLTQEAVDAIRATGKSVVMVAPTAQASRGVLREAGFDDADTLQRLLIDQQFQQRLQDGVLWIDEAGLVGSRDLAKTFELARQYDARVILMGDSKQHKSVTRGAALRLLEQQAGLMPVEVKEIRRQSGAYRDAVADLAALATALRVSESGQRLRTTRWRILCQSTGRSSLPQKETQ